VIDIKVSLVPVLTKLVLLNVCNDSMKLNQHTDYEIMIHMSVYEALGKYTFGMLRCVIPLIETQTVGCG
jgi:hypothetical protein